MRAPDIVTADVRARLVDDGPAAYGVDRVFPSTDPAHPDLAPLLTDAGGVPMAHHCLLVRSGDRVCWSTPATAPSAATAPRPGVGHDADGTFTWRT